MIQTVSWVLIVVVSGLFCMYLDITGKMKTRALYYLAGSLCGITATAIAMW